MAEVQDRSAHSRSSRAADKNSKHLVKWFSGLQSTRQSNCAPRRVPEASAHRLAALRASPHLRAVPALAALLLLLFVAPALGVAALEPTNPNAVPGRLQWRNAGGYCGETSAQMGALLQGNWVSQSAWRTAGGGELLLGVNLEAALGKMRLTYSKWSSSTTTQYSAFSTWMHSHLAAARLVIFSEYVTDAGYDPDYDHIVLAVGASAAADFTFYNLYSTTPVVLSNVALPATRSACARTLLQGGCAPAGRNYGVTITGVAGGGAGVLLPVRLAVNRADEPNTSPVNRRDPDDGRAAPEAAVTLTGMVTVTGLTAGRAYKLLRYNTAASVPTGGTAAQWIASAAAAKVDFTAAGASWTYADTFLSSATVFYRCVAVPVVG